MSEAWKRFAECFHYEKSREVGFGFFVGSDGEEFCIKMLLIKWAVGFQVG